CDSRVEWDRGRGLRRWPPRGHRHGAIRAWFSWPRADDGSHVAERAALGPGPSCRRTARSTGLRIRRKRRPLGWSYRASILAGTGALGALYAEELARCFWARNARHSSPRHFDRRERLPDSTEWGSQ